MKYFSWSSFFQESEHLQIKSSFFKGIKSKIKDILLFLRLFFIFSSPILFLPWKKYLSHNFLELVNIMFLDKKILAIFLKFYKKKVEFNEILFLPLFQSFFFPLFSDLYFFFSCAKKKHLITTSLMLVVRLVAMHNNLV